LGQGRFGPAQSYFTGTNPVSVTVADLNGDHVRDLVVADQGSNDVTVLLGNRANEGGTTKPWFQLGPRLNSGGTGPVSTLVKDVTGPKGVSDGIPDIVVTNSTSNNLAVLPGVGQGFFNDRQPTITPLPPTLPNPGAMAALPGPGAVVVNPGSGTVTIVPDVRVPVFAQVASGGSNPEAVVTGDFNGDGFTDLIVANNGNGLVDFLAGDPNGFGAPEVLPLDIVHPTDLAVSNSDDVLYVVGEDGQIGRFDLHRLALQPGDLHQGALLGQGPVPEPPGASPSGGEPESAPERPQVPVPLPLGNAAIALVATLLTGFDEDSLVIDAGALQVEGGNGTGLTAANSSSGGGDSDVDPDDTRTDGNSQGEGAAAPNALPARARLIDFLLGVGDAPDGPRLPDDDATGTEPGDTGQTGQGRLPAGREKRTITPPPFDSDSTDAASGGESPSEVEYGLATETAHPARMARPLPGQALGRIHSESGQAGQVAKSYADLFLLPDEEYSRTPLDGSRSGSSALENISEDSNKLAPALVAAFFASGLYPAADERRRRPLLHRPRMPSLR
jgi:hypothetical protein